MAATTNVPALNVVHRPHPTAHLRTSIHPLLELALAQTNSQGAYLYWLDHRLPGIRKREMLAAGKVLGIRRHFFLDQRDSGFATDAASAPTDNWDRTLRLSRRSQLSDRRKLVYRRAQIAGSVSDRLRQAPVGAVLAV
jgi:LmbE family N-acetylglucosaminyl deacetylase